MKIIFLDIDGVLNTYQTFTSSKRNENNFIEIDNKLYRL